jgi:Domain of Unknown Function (DUF1080)
MFVLPRLARAADDAIVPTAKMVLFNGHDLSGWKAVARSEGETTWTVTNGVIHCSGKPTGFLRTEKNYRNYKLTVEWRFVRVAPKADNTGVLVHMQLPDNVWPDCIQYQGKSQNQGDLIFMSGAESKEHLAFMADAKNAGRTDVKSDTPLAKRGPSNEKPVGEWNLCEMTCDGDAIEVWVNGKSMNTATECNPSSGAIGFQSEGGEFEIRQVFVEPLKRP